MKSTGMGVSVYSVDSWSTSAPCETSRAGATPCEDESGRSASRLLSSTPSAFRLWTKRTEADERHSVRFRTCNILQGLARSRKVSQRRRSGRADDRMRILFPHGRSETEAASGRHSHVEAQEQAIRGEPEAGSSVGKLEPGLPAATPDLRAVRVGSDRARPPRRAGLGGPEQDVRRSERSRPLSAMPCRRPPRGTARREAESTSRRPGVAGGSVDVRARRPRMTPLGGA